MILITTYYISNVISRQKEIQRCLIKNCENEYIEKIYLLNDNYYDMSFLHNDSKIIQIIIHSSKLNFKDAIKFINENLQDNICILANSDIYFDNSLSKIGSMNNKFYALLRYDETGNNLKPIIGKEGASGFPTNETHNNIKPIIGKEGASGETMCPTNKNLFKLYDCPRDDAQDAWIFQSPLKIDLNEIDFNFGTLGCDNIFANKIYETNIELSNPCYDIIITHVHLSDIRTYSEETRLKGRYCYIQPCNIYNKSSVRFEDII
jgi:hypothetical protein